MENSGSLEDLDSAPESESPSLAPLLQQALARRLRESIGDDRFSGFSQLASWQAGLVTGIPPIS